MYANDLYKRRMYSIQTNCVRAKRCTIPASLWSGSENGRVIHSICKGSHPSLAQMKQNHNSISLHVFCLFIKWLLLNKEPEKHNNKKMSIKYSPRGCHFGDSYSFMIEIQARKPAGMHSGCYQISSSSPPSHHHTLVRNGKEQT